MPKGRSILKALAKMECVNIPKTTKISDLKEYGIKTLAVDLSNMIHKNPTYMYAYILKLIKKFAELGYTLIFVFDGKPPDKKIHIINIRKDKRKKCQESLIKEQKILNNYKAIIKTEPSKEKRKELEGMISETNVNIRKYHRGSFKINRNHIKNLKSLFDFLKVQYIHFEDGEADLLCSTLVKMGIADAYLGDDYDPLAYGCTHIVRNLDITKGTVDIINVNDIYSKIKLSYEEFIYLIILNGTEYSEKIQGINITYIRALLILKFKIDEILVLIKKQKYDYISAYEIFTKHLDIEPRKDIVNYNEPFDIKSFNEKSEEYLRLRVFSNPYLCLAN